FVPPPLAEPNPTTLGSGSEAGATEGQPAKSLLTIYFQSRKSALKLLPCYPAAISCYRRSLMIYLYMINNYAR
ncbi:hypothetical protein, partial [Cloacibacillus evryensis]|uniref:hypothetical protein n=1 Tax=Cloacibacillus evryensis TaxID=508460 RepID=UPI0026DF88DD